ncbi:MAG TPA: NAD(P)-dependent oxidoreductase [Chthonomonadaceae bacterium]|nr:NAD(P)-dependent oxidoreductase [Chthonomonadaceae bacterium]
MSDPFQVGITRDFLAEGGKLTYKDIGLGLLEAEPRCRYAFLAEYQSPMRPEQIASLDAVLSLTPGWKAETFAGGAERLLIVARFGVGYDMCDVAALTANDVLLTITPGATDLPVAGGVLAMMLALSRRLFTKDRLVREGRWSERAYYQGTEIAGKVLGIVGFGGAGRELRRLIAPFGMRVLAYDPFVSDALLAEHQAQRASTLEALFAQSDYVSLHCLLNEETRGLIDQRLFDLMKPTAYFFNAARGPIVNEADLIAALQGGRIAGAGLDVFEQEPPAPDNPLLQMENVLLAPHAVCWTDECFQAIGESAVRSILSVLRGERPFGLLNPEVLERQGFQRKAEALQARIHTDS